MKIEVSMTVDTQKLEINSWWASEPAFAIKAFEAQIEAARILWPEAFKDIFLATTETAKAPVQPES